MNRKAIVELARVIFSTAKATGSTVVDRDWAVMTDAEVIETCGSLMAFVHEWIDDARNTPRAA